jgi:hypothetical protein
VNTTVVPVGRRGKRDCDEETVEYDRGFFLLPPPQTHLDDPNRQSVLRPVDLIVGFDGVVIRGRCAARQAAQLRPLTVSIREVPQVSRDLRKDTILVTAAALPLDHRGIEPTHHLSAVGFPASRGGLREGMQVL